MPQILCVSITVKTKDDIRCLSCVTVCVCVYIYIYIYMCVCVHVKQYVCLLVRNIKCFNAANTFASFHHIDCSIVLN